MKMQNRSPVVEYKQAFNPVIRRSPSQAQPQGVPAASQAAPKTEKAPAPSRSQNSPRKRSGAATQGNG